MKNSESKGKMMLRTVAQTSFPPGELKTVAETAEGLGAVPLPGVLSVKEEASKLTRPPSLQIKLQEQPGTTETLTPASSASRASLPHSSISLLLQKVIRISTRLTEASQLLAVLMRMFHPMEQRGRGLGP